MSASTQRKKRLAEIEAGTYKKQTSLKQQDEKKAKEKRTAIICSAALLNALKLVKKNIEDLTVVISGAGSAGIAIAKLFINLGVDAKKMLMLSSKGILCEGEPWMNPAQAEMAKNINQSHKRGKLAEAMVGADVFVGVSAPGILTEDMIKTMNRDPIVFAMANPVPEIMPDLAKKAGAAVVGTGRSDFPNQINNVLAFPGLFRGALDVRASDINEEMKLAAAKALADLIPDEELRSDYIIPEAFDKRVGPAVAKAVAQAARDSGVARI